MALDINLLNRAKSFGAEIEGADEELDLTTSAKVPAPTSDYITIPLSKLINFSDCDGEAQPFDIEHKSTKYKATRDSIAKHGQLTPILVRDKGFGEYEILAGHTRVEVLKDLKIPTAKAVIQKDCNTDEQAYDCMIDSNIQRDKPTPLELARIFKHYLKHRRSNKDTGSDSLTTADMIATKFDIKRKQMYRYVKICNFTEALQTFFGKGDINVNDAEPLYNLLVRYADESELPEDRELSERQQNTLAEYLTLEACNLPHKRIKYLEQLVAYKPRFDLNDLDEYVFASESERKEIPSENEADTDTEGNTTTATTDKQSLFFAKLKGYFPHLFTSDMQESEVEKKIIELIESIG